MIAQDIFAVAAVVSSLLVITSKNPVISVLFLISVFVNSAIYLMFTGVVFIGISYIIVYVGAIAILFLFILMMINIRLTDILEVGRDYTKNLPLALFIGILFMASIYGTYHLVTLGVATDVVRAIDASSVETYLRDFTQIESVGHNLYTTSAVLLIITSIILLLSMLAPIMLSSFYKKIY